jgi:GNAT superfamily N-acetyltransferase
LSCLDVSDYGMLGAAGASEKFRCFRRRLHGSMTSMTSMTWQTTGDVAEFLAVAGPYLRRERARNTTILTVTESMRVSSAQSAGASAGVLARADAASLPLLGWWSDPSDPSDGSDQVAGAFMDNPPFPLVLTAVAPAAAELAAVTLVGRPLPGVNTYPDVAQVFAGAWQEAHGGRVDVHVHINQRLYRLAELTWPDPAPAGTARIAADSDVPLLIAWFTAFAAEVHDRGRPVDQSAAVHERLSYGGITVWEVDGEPVAIAGATRQVASMVRMGPVYTPPELRGRGYASAVTAAASQRVIKAGAEDVLLYTDLANPVSNSIYQRIGYRAVEDRVVLNFTTE